MRIRPKRTARPKAKGKPKGRPKAKATAAVPEGSDLVAVPVEEEKVQLFRSTAPIPKDRMGAALWQHKYHFKRDARDHRGEGLGLAPCKEPLEGMTMTETVPRLHNVSTICPNCCLLRPALAAKFPGCTSNAIGLRSTVPV